ncbi:hypothetical protein V494_01296 [Pseudogymnoascus sp. VKM F-4513 (FW-928)]|nr:hypothetical protein V494_01296 [Pseudogymnoascus sp. VKM F-4513 (FW-928)]
MVKRALWGVMLNCDVSGEPFPGGESMAVTGATIDWAAMWAVPSMQGHEVLIKIFDSIERLLGRTSINIASTRLNFSHEMRMPSLDVSVKFIFA